MRLYSSYSKFKIVMLLIISFSLFVSCTDDENELNCDGYTGPVTNKQALALQAKCHFMPKDTIEVWTARYQKNKPRTGDTTLSVASILGDSCSFNNSIVRAIIANEKCIGLRVVYGMDENNKVHIILVGINPDYSTLYIKKPKGCGIEKNASAKDGNGDDDDDDDLGGGEYAEMP
jgi:hypothetical protein